MGVAGVDKGREGWGKGREDWGEKVADSLSFLVLFSLPAPSPSLHLPLRLLWLLWTRYTLGFSKATVCLVSRKTLPAYHIMNIFCLNTEFFLSSQEITRLLTFSLSHRSPNYLQVESFCDLNYKQIRRQVYHSL